MSGMGVGVGTGVNVGGTVGVFEGVDATVAVGVTVTLIAGWLLHAVIIKDSTIEMMTID
jgi:hypothetical protein